MYGKRNVSMMVVAFAVLALVSIPSGASEWELSPSSERGKLAEVSMQQGAVTLSPRVDFKSVRVTVSGPDGIVFEERFKEAPIVWHLEDSQGKALLDGRYQFEVRFLSGNSSDETQNQEPSKVINGSFSIKNGVVNTVRRSSIPQMDVADLRKPMQKDFAKANDDDFLWVSDKIGVGMDDSATVPGAELHMQQSGGAEILLEERLGSYGGAIEGQWRISGRDTLFTVGHRPNGTGTERENIVIEENAPQNQVYLDSSGNIGFGTSTPVADFHISSIDGHLRIEDPDDSTWDFREIAGDMHIRLAATDTGDTLGDKLVINGDGNIGIGGIYTPVIPLHIYRNTGSDDTAFRLENTGGNRFDFINHHATGGGHWQFINTSGVGGADLVIRELTRNAQEEFRLTEAGRLTISGQIYTGGGTCGSGCDRVFEPGFDIPSIEEHAALMWANGFLPEVGPTVENAPINLSEMTGRMLNELEKAHIYIEQLSNNLAEKNNEVEDLTQRLEALESLVNSVVENN